jgi:hypothetical protein
MKAKHVHSGQHHFQQYLNNALEKLTDCEIIDIKHAVTSVFEDGHGIEVFSALILYRERVTFSPS